MDKFFECDCPRCKPEIYIINKDERIKELEQELEVLIISNRTHYEKTLELEQELERYKDFYYTIKNNVELQTTLGDDNFKRNVVLAIKEFEEAKE